MKEAKTDANLTGEVAEALYGSLLNGTAPRHQTVAACIDAYLSLRRDKGTKPKTYSEIAYHLDAIKEWYGNLPASSIDESTIQDAFTRIAQWVKDGKPVVINTKHKRFMFLRSFVHYLHESHVLADLPRNLHSRLLNFKQSHSDPKSFDASTIKIELANLPDKLRLWALLGLNCGMTQADIGALAKDMVKGAYLTRKRVKTADNPNVPTVRYKLWKETLALLKKFKSNHATLWLTTERGTPLVSTRMENGRYVENDGIARTWKQLAPNCPITPAKFRNAGASILRTHQHYRQDVDLFLGHTAKTMSEKHYAHYDQKLFDEALDWLRTQVIA